MMLLGDILITLRSASLILFLRNKQGSNISNRYSGLSNKQGSNISTRYVFLIACFTIIVTVAV